jgi:cytidylate kinase
MKSNSTRRNNTMNREYDFSKAVRGKFYRKGAEIRLPIYLDAKVQAQVERLSRKKGKEIGEIVNQLVQKEMELIEELT